MATNEVKIPIPARLYNASEGGHVAGADQIVDDETGLTLDKVAGGALEEKEYTSGSDNGMGRVVLRKNLVEGVNTLTQAMINKSNTIYVIQYDFTLAFDVTIPANCVLEFEGGSISGEYTLTGNNTGIKAGLVKIFSTDITFAGNWNVKEVYPEWFYNNSWGEAIINCINLSVLSNAIIKFTAPLYELDVQINISDKNNLIFVGNNSEIRKPANNYKDMFWGERCNNITFKNIIFNGNYFESYQREEGWDAHNINACMRIADRCSNIFVRECTIKNFNYGIFLGGATNSPSEGEKISVYSDFVTISNCIFENNWAAIDTYNKFGTTIDNNLFKNNKSITIRIEPYSTFDPNDKEDSDVFTTYALMDSIRIINNTFVTTDDAMPMNSYITLYPGCTSVIVNNNSFIGGDRVLYGQKSKHISITNNIIRKIKLVCFSIDNLYGCLKITNNIISNCYQFISANTLNKGFETIIAYNIIQNASYFDYFSNVTNFRLEHNSYQGEYANKDLNLSCAVRFDNISGLISVIGNHLRHSQTAPYRFIFFNFNQASIAVEYSDNTSDDTLSYYYVERKPNNPTKVGTGRPYSREVGYRYFDTNLNKPIYWTGDTTKGDNGWVDANGNNPSIGVITKSGALVSGNVPEFDGTTGALKDSGKAATSIH